jgi:hypothetical protein
LSANALTCSSFLDRDGAPTALGLESLRVTVRLKTSAPGVESLSTTKKPRRSNCELGLGLELGLEFELGLRVTERLNIKAPRAEF